jgi:hypothetical protein
MVQRALAKAPGSRPQTAREFEAELAAAAAAAYGADWRSRASLAGLAATSVAAGGVAGALSGAGAVAGAVAPASVSGGVAAATAMVGGQTVVAVAPTGVVAAATGGTGTGILHVVAGVGVAAVVAAGSPAIQVAPPPPEIITPAQAVQVVENAWIAARSAYAAHNPSADTLALSFSGSALDRVSALITTTPQAGAVDPLSRTLDGVRVYVPRQRSYPASFLAQAHVNTSLKRALAGVYIFVNFARTSVSEPWKAIALDIQDDVSVPHILLDREGYTVPLDLKDLAVAPDQLAKLYSDYLNSSLATGAAPAGSVFAAGVHTTDQASADRAYISDERGRHIRHSFAYAPAGNPAQIYPISGGALVAFNISLADDGEPDEPGICVVWVYPDSLHDTGRHSHQGENRTEAVLAEVFRKTTVTAGKQSLVVIASAGTISDQVTQPPCFG